VTEVLLSARALEKSYGRTQALRGISRELSLGEVLAVTGPSGSGKSTLLHCLSGIVRADAGEVTYRGQPLEALNENNRIRLRRREFGIILQFGQLVPELTRPVRAWRHFRNGLRAVGDFRGHRPGAVGGLPGRRAHGRSHEPARETGGCCSPLERSATRREGCGGRWRHRGGLGGCRRHRGRCIGG
jgi:hypothetical protein